MRTNGTLILRDSEESETTKMCHVTFLPSDKASIFTVILSWRRDRGKERERERERTSSLRKLPSALLHHCRSASPSSPGCPPLDTLNWIPVRCAASSWGSFLRVTEHAVRVCTSVCPSLCVKKLSSFPNRKNGQHKMTNAHKQKCAHTYTQFKAQFASGSGPETARTY